MQHDIVILSAVKLWCILKLYLEKPNFKFAGFNLLHFGERTTENAERWNFWKSFCQNVSGMAQLVILTVTTKLFCGIFFNELDHAIVGGYAA